MHEHSCLGFLHRMNSTVPCYCTTFDIDRSSISGNNINSSFLSPSSSSIMFFINLVIATIGIIGCYLALRLLSKTSIQYTVKKWWLAIEDGCHVHQLYKVPKFNEHMQENQLYLKVLAYLNSLSSVEDSDFAHLLSGYKSNEIKISLDPKQVVTDGYLGARVHWKLETNCLVLKIRRKDKRRILRPYLQHIHTVFDEIEDNKKEVKLYINAENEPEKNGRWISLPLNHPATIDTSLIDADVKNKVKSDLELFLKSKQYYRRLGRAWRRSYLLYGPSGSGKSSFVAGIAKFLRYDVYEIDLSKVSDDSDLKMLLLQTTTKSVILIEDLDRYLIEKSTTVTFSGFLNFMDGLFSGNAEERLMIYTVNGKDQLDPTVLRPGRIDVHIHFSLCNFTSFKTLASSHLGIKEHKLFPQVEEVFQTGASLSPAELSEIMISNRVSPTRALKSVIAALQCSSDAARGAVKMVRSGSTRSVEDAGDAGVLCRESVHTVREFGKLYGLLRLRGSRKESIDLDSADKENSRPDP